ncbi:UDP-glucose 4-epimerase family protein [Alkalilimnicola sp. S0819]|uniref:UDP-glucose 4-epimerase family protein n=1 Tax=Alkalilimnicola sp. S0819 TaxID=2613922 RepID=UPI0021F80DC0|nr:SDR family oxidoreductase [Alkalilimnicola sp. S0819]
MTGASGFVGRGLIEQALTQWPLRAAVRRPTQDLPEGVELAPIAGLGPDTDWTAAVAEVGVVVHAAARVHVMGDRAADPLAEFRQTNVQGTLRLAEQAAAAGVKRFIYLSSIKVNGESTEAGRPFQADTPPAPVDPYGVSKHEAEDGLYALAAKTGMELTIIRPPLVYGPGVKANFHAMMRWLHRGVPLPLGAIDNRRSLVARGNLVDLILRCLEHPAAANQLFLVSDGEDLSTTDLLRRMGRALNRPARLLPVPPAVLKLGGTLLGRAAVFERLCGSLQVDSSKARELLGWVPPLTVDEGLRLAAEDFLRHAG